MNRSTLTFVFAFMMAIIVGLASAREAQYFYNSVSGEVMRLLLVWCSISMFMFMLLIHSGFDLLSGFFPF